MRSIAERNDRHLVLLVDNIATILVTRGEWEEARQSAVRFLSAGAEVFTAIWADVLRFFGEAVSHGFAALAPPKIGRHSWDTLRA